MLWQERERRKAIRRRLETIRDMNHHIRSAVQALTFYIRQDEETVKTIDDSLYRVDWVLREILPDLHVSGCSSRTQSEKALINCPRRPRQEAARKHLAHMGDEHETLGIVQAAQLRAAVGASLDA